MIGDSKTIYKDNGEWVPKTFSPEGLVIGGNYYIGFYGSGFPWQTDYVKVDLTNI